MSQTKEGAQKTRDKILKNYGKDYYAQIGRRGGLAKVPKGFATLTHEEAVEMGKRGAKIRKQKKKEHEKKNHPFKFINIKFK